MISAGTRIRPWDGLFVRPRCRGGRSKSPLRRLVGKAFLVEEGVAARGAFRYAIDIQTLMDCASHAQSTLPNCVSPAPFCALPALPFVQQARAGTEPDAAAE